MSTSPLFSPLRRDAGADDGAEGASAVATPRLHQDTAAVIATAAATATAAVAAAAPAPQRVPVWDLPLRLFHGSLALAVPAAIASGLAGGAWMRVHGIVGLFIVGLLAFRLVWGFIGSRHARFGEFLPTPRTLLAYLRGRWRGQGHNPLGALAVFAMLALLVGQVLSGLFSNDDIAFAGPWSALLADETVARITAWHRRFAVWLYALLALHVLAIGWYTLIRRAGLISAMVSGVKAAAPEETAAPLREGLRGSEYAAVLALFVAILVVYFAAGISLPFAGEAVPEVPAW